jgi:hypothetical protein
MTSSRFGEGSLPDSAMQKTRRRQAMQNARRRPTPDEREIIPVAMAPKSRHRVAMIRDEDFCLRFWREGFMKFLHLALAAVAIGAVAGFLWPASADPLPMDTPVNADGVESVCTGIGSDQDDPRWKAYPVRVEFSNGGAQYLAGAHVVLSSGGKTMTAFDCAGAWVLFKLAPGTYKVTASLLYNQGGGTRSAAFSPPASGQKRVVLQFPKKPNQ